LRELAASVIIAGNPAGEAMKKYPNLKTAHKETGCPGAKCQSIVIKPKSFNCYLSASQALELARDMLLKAQIILEYGDEDTDLVHGGHLPTTKHLSVGLWARKRKSGDKSDG
jgi:hypothetical protein